MRTKTILSIFGATAALGTGGIAATSAIASSSPSSSASSGQPAGTLARHIEGPITAINRAAGTFMVADREHSTSTTVKVTPNTRFDGIRGFGALRTGERVEVKAASVAGTVTATKVERADRAEDRHAGIEDRRNHDRFDDRGHDRRDDRGHDRRDDRGHDRGHDRNDD
ncbi:MAG TPA: DUF5666 domain-containing protein [Solirubrobacteraceae bacterium]